MRLLLLPSKGESFFDLLMDRLRGLLRCKPLTNGVESDPNYPFASLHRRRVIILVKAGAPVDATISGLMEHMEEGDIIIDGGNEW